MLILTRRVGETVIIGNDVDVTVLGVKGNQVRLGVKAPKDIAVHREEIYQRICQEKSGNGVAAELSNGASSGSANGGTTKPNGHGTAVVHEVGTSAD